ncbi:acyl CoA:acetate/3-ketoacid CoA transferase [Tuberibacillus sp. Marseille-P3662]|uniref:acyl CoA:acetate/3-ketoacid CoA transferase n=1 Tax=Tuberibacillus sp. Marseille-P3662 TaxID=1965358 RepID=UPI000A1C92DC|nr:CoA-transferase [Tuberibacillus sp. Marseille-P3662]
MDINFRTGELVNQIADGSTIALVGFGGMGQCDKILQGIRDRFLETGHPRNLTIFHTAGQSDRYNGIEYIAEDGLITRVIGGHWGMAPKLQKLIKNNKVDCYCFPQGQLTHLLRTMANKLPGQISPIGLGTFIDPRINGGKFNERTKLQEDLVKIMKVDGEDFLFYQSIPFDYVFIRGTTIDENGNITTEEEPVKLELLSAAQAAKAFGGQVLAQVKYRAKRESLHPKDVVVPGYLVDGAVIAENVETEHRQLPNSVYNPVFSGDLRTPSNSLETLPLSARKVIGRRALMELNTRSVVNIGIGIPGDVIGSIAHEEQVRSNIILTLESGIIGGVPVGGNAFGIARNAEAIIDHEYLFDFYHGAGVDITYMGAAEIDQCGNVNVSQFGNKFVGCGGFIDITQPAKKVVFCTTFTGGGLEISMENGQISINREGTIKKFTYHVNQITFSGNNAIKNTKEVLYVTERAVFCLTPKGLVLKEIAPGVDLKRDILDQMNFEPIIDRELKTMDGRIFRQESMHTQTEKTLL